MVDVKVRVIVQEEQVVVTEMVVNVEVKTEIVLKVEKVAETVVEIEERWEWLW